VLAWVFARCAGRGAARETPIGLLPPVGGEGIDTNGLEVSDEDMAELLRSTARNGRPSFPSSRAPRQVREPAGRAATSSSRRSSNGSPEPLLHGRPDAGGSVAAKFDGWCAGAGLGSSPVTVMSNVQRFAPVV